MKTTVEKQTATSRRISIGIAFHSAAQPLRRALRSALAQSAPGYEIVTVILDSSPRCVAREIVGTMATHPNVRFLRGHARSAHEARNRLIEFAESRVARLDWHVRLDADDTFTSRDALARAFVGVNTGHRVILAGNRQISTKGRLVGRNLPTADLRSRPYLLRRIAEMAAGRFKSELPSCNLILRAGYGWRYPPRESAEDHWLLASLLLRLPSVRLAFRMIELIDYHVGGQSTDANLKSGAYLSERRLLLEAAKGWKRND